MNRLVGRAAGAAGQPKRAGRQHEEARECLVHRLGSWVRPGHFLKNGSDAKEAIPALTTALKDPDGITRMNASLALLMMEEDARSALPELEEAIERKENNKRVLLFTLTIREQMLLDRIMSFQ